MDKLFQFLDAIDPLRTEAKNFLLQVLYPMRVAKNEHLFKAGKINPNAYFIVSGLIRCYQDSEPNHKKDISIWFLIENDFIANQKLFLTGKPSYENIQALEDSEVIRIPWAVMYETVSRFPEIYKHLYFISFEYSSLWHDLFTGYLLCEKSMDKYNFIARHHPHILERVPQKYLASFLGISPEHLSSIRGKMAKKK